MNELPYLRQIFNKLDRLYAERRYLDLERCYDILVNSIEKAIKDRNKILGGKSREDVERELYSTVRAISGVMEEIENRGPRGLIKRLSRYKDVLEKSLSRLGSIIDRLENKRSTLEAQIKSLMRLGKMGEAQQYIPRLTVLERNIKSLRAYHAKIDRIKSRIEGVIETLYILDELIPILIIEDLTKIVRDKEELAKYLEDIRMIKQRLEDAENFVTELEGVLDLTRGVPSIQLTDEEMTTYRRLLEEVLQEDLPQTIRKELENFKSMLEQKEREIEDYLRRERMKDEYKT
ncbi:MAG: hypothetical protein GXO23_00750 [Crenarchaeota archaeon]|nr:hypothetical protein [Thermoproteota archaeon]